MTEFKETELDERAINMAKVLSADAVEKAGSGHPGSPVSLAPVAYTLYQHFIKHDPNDPNWEGRDRFILSGGHASLTQYVQLYFSGYGVTLDDLKHFRGGADTRTPGHPEYGLTPGIEMTTGPLGQGFASAIGFAYGERFQRGLLDPETPKEESPFYHKIWAICGEGDIEEKFDAWRKANPDKAALYDRLKAGELPEGFDKALDDLEATFEVGKKVATRGASGSVLNAIAAVMPELWGGSADLGGSNKTDLKGAATFAPAECATKQWPVCNEFGRQLHFGVREFTMGCITNGILLGSHTRPFGGTFFMFSDYERSAVRLAALMEIPNLYVWTHDSVAVGEDGPTHQPVEHLASFRAIPQLEVIRPADAFETAEAYRYFFEKKNTWYKYLGSYGKPVSIEQFGLQGDGAQNMIDLGITAEHVVEAAKASIAEAEAAK